MVMVLLLEAPRAPSPVQQFSSHSYNRCHGSCRTCTSDQKEDLFTLLVQAHPQKELWVHTIDNLASCSVSGALVLRLVLHRRAASGHHRFGVLSHY